MSSEQQSDKTSAEKSYRQAFERLKSGRPKLLPLGSPVTQNNVAREAGRDPSALKLTRYPALVRQIQAFLELHDAAQEAAAQRTKRRRAATRSINERLADALRQRDEAQSRLASANQHIVELTVELQRLKDNVEGKVGRGAR